MRLSSEGLSTRQIAASLAIGRTTLRGYLDRASELGLSWPLLPITAWHDVIGEPTFADAILDRIVHNAYRIELEGASMRKTITKMDDETPQT